MTKTVEEYKEMEMILASEENPWGDNDPNDSELLFGDDYNDFPINDWEA